MKRYAMALGGKVLGCAAIAAAGLAACGAQPAPPGAAFGGQAASASPGRSPACGTGPARHAWAELVSGTGKALWRVQLPTNATQQGVYVQPVALGVSGGGAGTAVFAEYDTVYGLSAADGRQLWRWSAGQWIYDVWGWQGTAVVLSGQVGPHAELAGIDAATGAVRWTLELPGQGLYGSQALTGDGGLAMLTPGGTVSVADLATGHLRWSHQPGGPAPSPGPTPEPAAQQQGSASPVAVGSVVVGTAGGRAIGYDSRTGTTLWTATGLPVAQSLVAAAGLILVTSAAIGPSMPATVTALVPATGQVAWRFDAGAPAWVQAWGPAGIVLSTDAPSRLYLVDPATGRARWHSAAFIQSTGHSGHLAAGLVTARDIIMPEGQRGQDGRGQAIVDRSAADGSVRWSVPVSGWIPAGVPLLSVGSRVVAVVDPSSVGAGALLAVGQADGSAGWRAPMPTALWVPPAVAGAGVLAQSSDASYGCPLAASAGGG